MKMTGIVLAGGRSRRFGQDKALATLDNVTLIQRSTDLLKEIGLEPVVITNESADYSFLNCRIERDVFPDHGPLGGLYTAMKRLTGTLLVLTCDMPFLEPEVIRELVDSHKSPNKITVFEKKGDVWQPFPGVYNSALCELIGEHLQKSDLSMQRLLERVPEREIIISMFGPKVFSNVNHKSELIEK